MVDKVENAEAYLAAIVDSSDDAIISKSLDGVITTWNRSAERIFGFTPAEAIGKHITIIIPEERQDEEFVILGKVKAGQRVDHFETVRRTKNGALIDISLTVSPIRNEQGLIIGASKIARDISEQKHIAAALGESNRRRDEFLANMSHELRTPLNAIIGLSQILASKEALSAKGQQYVMMIRQSGDSLLDLINSLLDYSKAESGMLQIERVEFSLPELVEKVAVLQDAAVRLKGLDFNVNYQGSLKEVYVGDPLRLQQVLTNLVANAVKFTEKGAIEINVALKTETEDQSMVWIEVTDTGIGIPRDKLDIVFEKFTQVDASTQRTHGGSGLGLSICKALVEAMGGAIAVVSSPGLGSSFTVKVPLGHSDRLQRVADTQSPPRKNVLVVEDFEPNVVVLGHMLEELGYSYDVASNGLEGYRRAERGVYDVVLMDIQMPGMDGFESAGRIRALEQERGSPRTPIVAVTAHVFEKDKARCLEAGMDDFIVKPLHPAQVKNLLGRLISA